MRMKLATSLCCASLCGRSRTSLGKSVPRETKILNHAAADQVLLNDPLGILRRHVAVPRALRIHHRDRPGGADAQALAPGAIAWSVGAGEIQLLQPRLEVFPRRLAGRRIDAIRPDADEQVPAKLPDA